ncbi:MAG: two-component regulator propeller domain-containing protein [Ignavibacteriaceae bacterium]
MKFSHNAIYPKSKKLTLISLIIIVCTPVILFPQESSLEQADRINYVHILSEDGLSQNTVHSIIQDKEGFIWFATEDGLNKYDGYNFKVYKNNPLEKNSIPDNFIWTIYEDRSGTLWVGTNNKGLCRFDRSTEQFITYNNIPGNPATPVHNNVRAIYEDKEGNLWIGTEGGLDKFDKKKNIFIHFRNMPGDPNSLSNNVVLSVFEDNSGEIWFGNNDGLSEFNKKSNKFTNYSLNSLNDANSTNNVVFSICEDKAGYLWVGTLNGLVKFNKKDKTFKRYLMGTPGPYGSNINRINSLLEDKNGLLWIATGSGLFQIDNSKNVSGENLKPYNTNMLTGNNVLSLYEDNSGLIWIGTAEDGVIKFDKERIKFKYFAHDAFNPSSLSYGTIRAIYKEDNGNLWVGTLGGGLNKLEPSSGKFIHYKNNPDNKYSLSDNSVSAIFKDSYGYLWVGTWRGGLNKSVLPLSKTSGNLKFKHYKNEPAEPNSLSNNLIQSIFEDSDRRLWIGTGIGLNLYNRQNDNFIIFKNNPDNPNSISEDQVQSCIIEDRNGNMWIGTWNGLNKLTSAELKNVLKNPSSVKFIHFRNTQNNLGLSDDRVISAYEDRDDNLWFGTYGGGLNMLSPEEQNKREPNFIHYTIKDGLPSNVIYAIQGENSGQIWISTDNGLSSINIRVDNIRNYDANDGLQGNQFFWGASFKSSNNELFFGGTKGLNAFYPGELRRNNHIPPIVITSFQIFNKPVEINVNNSPLKKSITETKEIELSYGQNVFSFEFSALDYVSPYKNRYAYMMEGFDENWIYSGNRRYITYTNLDPGKYVFKVKGSNNDGIWNEKGVQLTIKILPPLWRTWWFITLASITILGIIGLIIYFRIKNLIEIGRFRAKLAADLHDNIGSSLTEISILSEVISKKIKTEEKDVTKSLRAISSNARSLVDNMSDIVWLVNPKRDSLYDLILRLRDTYSELSSYTNISFRSENIISLQKVTLSMEHRQNLYLIFKEAINNCITHSSCTEINLDASVKGRILGMTLKDNGKGFCIDDLKDGNGLENMQNRAKKIGGHLNIDSKIGEGTVIQFQGNIS